MAREDRVQPRNEHATSTGASPATTTSSISSKRSWAALASQAGKPKGGCERDGCSRKKDFVAFLFIHHNVLEAL
jgi:hypothetical protein